MTKTKITFLVLVCFITSIFAINLDDFNTIKNLILSSSITTNNFPEIVFAVSANRSVLGQIDTEDNTLLHYAIEAGSPDIVNFLLKMGANPNLKYGKNGNIVAIFDAINAITKNQRPFNLENNDPRSRVLESLVKGNGSEKAIINGYIQDKLTPLALAIKNSQKPPSTLVLFLLNNGANPMIGFRAKSKKQNGDYPLNIAVSNFASKVDWQNNVADFKNLILTLIKFNANVTVADSFGRKPIEVLTYSLEDMYQKGTTANSSRIKAALLLLFNNGATDDPGFQEFLSKHPILQPVYNEYQESAGSSSSASSGHSTMPLKPLRPASAPATPPLSPLRPPVTVPNIPVKIIPLGQALKDLSVDLSSLANYK